MSRPSTRNPRLPDPLALERLSQSLATLDAILCPEWGDRYYSFDKDWNAEKEQRMASMRNGCGDEYFILFTKHGVALKGFAHESPMARETNAGVLDGFPEVIEDFLTEPAFSMNDTTFCLWCLPGQEWSMGSVRLPDGEDPDGSEDLLELLSGAPEDYQGYARDYFEVEVPLGVIEHIYAHEPLTDELVRSLNPDTSLADLEDDIDQIGYPRGR